MYIHTEVVLETMNVTLNITFEMVKEDLISILEPDQFEYFSCVMMVKLFRIHFFMFFNRKKMKFDSSRDGDNKIGWKYFEVCSFENLFFNILMTFESTHLQWL